ncbi:MAG: hypothetical protein RL654_1269 [Pseudomonadota bacterium]|jgi:predicted PurR-regulated permease PerM
MYNRRILQQKTFLILLALASIAFALVLLPLWVPVFWGTVLAMMAAPMCRQLMQRVAWLHERRGTAAALTVLLVLLGGIVPVVLFVLALSTEVLALYQQHASEPRQLAGYIDMLLGRLPPALTGMLQQFGLADAAALRDRLLAGLARGSQAMAAQVLALGQNLFASLLSLALTLYLMFFMLRDGAHLSRRVRQALPLAAEHKSRLIGKFATVVKATVRGSIVVALVQGLLGGLAFMVLGLRAPLLWGALMALLSLLPAVGAGLVWVPAVLWLAADGRIEAAAALVVWGVLVIGLADNLLRPLLVGKDTRLPDYLVLVSTLGGLSLFGVHGIVLGPAIAALFIAAWDLLAADTVGPDDHIVTSTRASSPTTATPRPASATWTIFSRD